MKGGRFNRLAAIKVAGGARKLTEKKLYQVIEVDGQPKVLKYILPDAKVDIRSGKEKFITVGPGESPEEVLARMEGGKTANDLLRSAKDSEAVRARLQVAKGNVQYYQGEVQASERAVADAKRDIDIVTQDLRGSLVYRIVRIGEQTAFTLDSTPTVSELAEWGGEFVVARKAVEPADVLKALGDFPDSPTDFKEMVDRVGDANNELHISYAQTMYMRSMVRDYKTKRTPALTDMMDPNGWGLTENMPNSALWAKLVLQKNTASRLHSLASAINAQEIKFARPEDKQTQTMAKFPEDVHPFVVCHDWAAVIGPNVEGDIHLPFEQCAFEYRISNRTVIVLARQLDGQPAQGVGFYEAKDGSWLFMGTVESEEDAFWWNQVRAACIMLDAEVATHTVTRQPDKLNAKRLKNGKLPLFDFHTIDLAKRHRVQARERTEGPPTHHKRLHWVRGHWRHFETHNTWIKWHLRGDETLGVIASQYKL